MRQLLAALLAGLVASATHAEMVQVESVDAASFACLTRPGSLPTYPDVDAATQRTGFVRLSMKFVAPGQVPEVAVLFRDASDAMVAAVQTHVLAYRLPCLAADAAPVVAVQEFSFTPARAEASPATPPALAVPPTPVMPSLKECLRVPDAAPGLAADAHQRASVSNVVIEATFTSVDTEPAIQVLYASVGRKQLAAVTDHMRQYRLSCMPGSGKQTVVQRSFRYQVTEAGASTTQVKFKGAVALGSFLRGIKDIQLKQAEFDFTTMACPFQVAWTLGKPALENRVVDLGRRDLNRVAFLAWLRSLEMNAPGQLFESLLGETIVIDVPCGRLSLTGQG